VLEGLAAAPAQLLIVDADPGARDAAPVCRARRDDASLGEAWLPASTDRAASKTAIAALQAGADDYLSPPFSRTELLARTRSAVWSPRELQR
jgi:two-component system phosphate regulon response regulator PhoB/two-component system alkaline phosphatase synthesis response regulator PhoP